MSFSRTLAGLLWLVSVGLGACGGDDDDHTAAGGNAGHSPGTGGAVHSTGGTGGSAAQSAAGAPGAAGGGGTSNGPPEAPVMQSVEPLGGALHIEWTNQTIDCTAIELWRKQDAEAYALAYTLTGQAEAQHDSEATTPAVTYCYKARCIRGAEMSSDSNEECGSP